MSKRREFTRAVKAEIMMRAKRVTGFQCENESCGLIVTRGEIHHEKQDALETDKTGKLTAGDGVFLCEPCHDSISRKQQTVLAKVLRVEAKAIRAVVPISAIKSAPMPTTARAAKRQSKPPVLRQFSIYRDL